MLKNYVLICKCFKKIHCFKIWSRALTKRLAEPQLFRLTTSNFLHPCKLFLLACEGVLNQTMVTDLHSFPLNESNNWAAQAVEMEGEITAW